MDIVERIERKIEQQKNQRGDIMYLGNPDPEYVDALAEITRLRADREAVIRECAAVVQSYINLQLKHGNSDKHQLLCNVRDSALALIDKE